MPQNADRLSVSMDLARILLRYASEHGLDGPKICRKAGLSEGLLQSGDARLPARRFHALWRSVEEESGDDQFGLRLGSAAKEYAGGHLLFAILMNSPALEAALGKFCRYHCILSDAVQPRLSDRGDSPMITLETSHPEVNMSLGQEAFVFSLFAAIVETLTGSRTNIREVRFSYPAPKSVDLYRRLFSCPTRFDRKDSALLIRRSAMDKPVFLSNPELLSRLETMALGHAANISTGNPVSHRVALVLNRMLSAGEKISVGEVARALAMSTRLLQQRLRGEQTGYRQILEQARKEAAIRLLEDRENTICEITFILGFSDQSSFTHAFQSWTGTTPGQYRSRMRKKGCSKGRKRGNL